MAAVGATHGIVIALSGFGGHYGAYPAGQLISHSLLVGGGVVVFNLILALTAWRFLGKKRVLVCPACGHRE